MTLPRWSRPAPILAALAVLVLAMLQQTTGHATPPAEEPHTGAHHGPDTHHHHADQAAIAEVRAAVARYHRPSRAEAAGWGLVPGLDHCFTNPGVGAMGYHYIDTDQLGDPTLDPLRPEALVFVPGPTGRLRLGAVEYIVPTDLWPHEAPPRVLGRDLHVLEPVPGVEVWALHVWLFEPNPDGMFADWNPRVSCP
jgi:hypothetical protein